jgi:hypothetical protein
MLVKPSKTAALGHLMGYERVSTDEQGTDPQLDELRAAGCTEVLEEHASGADLGRPVMTGWFGWSPASPRPRRTAHCSRWRPSSRRCVNGRHVTPWLKHAPSSACNTPR